MEKNRLKLASMAMTIGAGMAVQPTPSLTGRGKHPKVFGDNHKANPKTKAKRKQQRSARRANRK